ncbi:integrase [Rhizobiaceae bacterium BDR2-2]|uniref:Integrase n=1 Tax=Ectorhizobium quercum TaxID=2965071 RepID=A0AAE3N1J8_9HYPH|nr:integrase [Ectorhizobium quercum]MCX8998262.1 integrase [Ectorhizobium quercum]
MTGFSALQRERAEREAARRLARAVTLEALDGVLTFARREELAARLTDGEAALLASFADAGRSAHTVRALAGDLDRLSLWWRAAGEGPLPLPPSEAVLRRFVETEQAADPPPSLSTLKRRLTSWAALTRAAGGETGVFDVPVLRAALAGRRPVRPKAQPLGPGDFERLLSTCDTGSLTDCRDRALLLTAFHLGLTPAQIAALDAADLEDGPPPRLLITTRKPAGADSPPDEAQTLPDAVFASLSLWRAQAQLSGGPLFRPVDRWQNPGRLGLTPQSVKLIVKARARAAGLDPAAFSARSLRRSVFHR